MADRQQHVSDLLALVFRRGGMKRSMRRAQAVLLWPQVAGTQLSRFTRARNLVDGVLMVDVPDSETAMHLTLQRQRFLDVFQGRFGAREVRDIRFQTGPTPRHDPEPPAPEQEVMADPQDLSRLAGALDELQLPEDLSEPALRAARSLLAYRARRRAQGWHECPTCAALTPDPGLCSTCQRYSLMPAVESAAERLAVDPETATPKLSEDERSVAGWMACRLLDSRLGELLPQVIAQPELRGQLEAAARCYLALTLDKPPAQLDDGDLAALPQRVARVLGHWR